LSVEHPAWAHQFRYVIQELEKKGHTFKVVAINKDRDLELLDAFGIPYEVICNSSGNNIVEKGFIFLWTTLKIFLVSLKFKPDLFIGRASPMMAINSYIFRRPHILFEDSEPTVFCLEICKLFSKVIITPRGFTKNLGRKQIRIDAYKELFYLHPSYFQPDPAILNKLGIRENEKFILCRFVAMNAHHDIGHHGIQDPVGLVKQLEQYGKVFVSSEKQIPPELEKYQLKIPLEKIHDVLYYATLFISDSQTMTTEAALLGTPAIRCNSFVGKNDMSNYIELEQTYHMIYNYQNEDEIIKKAIDLIHHSNVKEEWQRKRERLLKEKIDVSKFMIWFIENYPASYADMKEHPESQSPYAHIPIEVS
jgi:predicted glycosyltransferase